MPVTGLTQDVQAVVLSLMEGLATPRALTVSILLRYGEWGEIFRLEIDPKRYMCSEKLFADYQATSFLKKLDGLTVPGVDPEAAAVEKWWEAERMCFCTNRKLDEYVDSGDLILHDDDLGRSLLSVRTWVTALLGRAPKDLDGFFGPGATLSDLSRMTTVCDKMSSLPTLTPDQWPLLSTWVGTKWGQAYLSRRREGRLGCGADDFDLVRGNIFFCAPKTALVSRPCAKEPSLPAFYQLGLGRVMRRRLKERGIDLEKAQDTHRRVACAASLSGESATIDLSSASDTISRLLVKAVFPKDWYEQLYLLRSPMTFIQGHWVRLEKFSSMGNGYTFELETVLFAAIAMSVCHDCVLGRDVHVYGDDIIVPTRHAQGVCDLLQKLGFRLNKEKTFLEGSFRESCGGDYFNGIGVRPYSLKELPNEPQQIIAIANGLWRACSQYGAPPRRSLLARRAWFKLLDLLPVAIRCCRGPEALGDIVIHDDERFWQSRNRASIRYIKCYRPAQYRKVRWEGFAYDVQFAAALYGVALQPQLPTPSWGTVVTRYLIPRDGVLGYKVGWVPYS